MTETYSYQVGEWKLYIYITSIHYMDERKFQYFFHRELIEFRRLSIEILVIGRGRI